MEAPTEFPGIFPGTRLSTDGLLPLASKLKESLDDLVQGISTTSQQRTREEHVDGSEQALLKIRRVGRELAVGQERR